MDAPLHVTENSPCINSYSTWRLCGTGVAVSIPKGKWGVITPEDLEKASPTIKEGDIFMINTGFHHKWADSDEYFAYAWRLSPGLVHGCQANDHPIATKLVDHGLGPSQPHLIQEYKDATGQ
jgi:kynurenine formamidase